MLGNILKKRALSHFRFGLTYGWLRRLTSSSRKAIKNIRNMYHSIGLENRPCTICGSNEFSLLAESDRYGFDLKKQLCKKCGLVQTNPSLKSEFLDEFYSYHYRPLYLKNKKVNYDGLIEEQTIKGKLFLDYLIKQGLEEQLPKISVIEIGCSSGGILAGLAPHVRSVQGCDLDIEGIEYGKRNFEFELEVSALPTNVPSSPKLFLMSHVLEHLHDPLHSISEVRKLMGKDDFLLIEVPGLNTVGEGNYGYDLWAYFHIAHVSDFTAGTMTALAAEAGLDILACNETVTALLKRSDDDKKPWTKSENDSVENVLRIEKAYQSK